MCVTDASCTCDVRVLHARCPRKIGSTRVVRVRKTVSRNPREKATLRVRKTVSRTRKILTRPKPNFGVIHTWKKCLAHEEKSVMRTRKKASRGKPFLVVFPRELKKTILVWEEICITCCTPWY